MLDPVGAPMMEPTPEEMEAMQAEVERQEELLQAQMMISELAGAQNIAEHLGEDQLNSIGEQSIREYRLDKNSMADWRKRMEKGLELAQLVKEDKAYPFKGCSNIKYPLVTSAALQFNARSYPAIVPSDQIVKVKVHGSDPGGKKAARADRIAAHMSYQLSTQIAEWEEETDKLLMMLPIVGTMVRKVWFDSALGRIRSRLVTAGQFVVNDKVKTLDVAPRITEELAYYPAEISERRASGDWLDVDLGDDGEGEDPDSPRKFIEQHRRIDLDEDGYPEPYIVVVHVDSQRVVSIVADFNEDDVSFGPEGVMAISRGSYFAAYHFLPSLDGGFFGTGLGLLLGDISESINSIINMQIDAGHYASLGGGFMGSEFRIKGGPARMKPGEWRMVGATGQDIRSSMVSATYPGPDQTLFQMLGLLIDAGREIAGNTEVLSGETAGVANMPATTAMALIEQGLTVFTSVYKRIYRALRSEFGLIAEINSQMVSPEEYNAFHDEVGPDGQPIMYDPAQEYGQHDMDVQPVADPRSVTKMQEAAKAQLVMQLAEAGMFDATAAAQRVAESMAIDNVDELLPKPDPQMQHMQKMQMQAAAADLALKYIEIDKVIAEIESKRASAIKDVADAASGDVPGAYGLAEMKLRAMRNEIERSLQSGLGGMASSLSGPGPEAAPQEQPGSNQAVPGGVDMVAANAGYA